MPGGHHGAGAAPPAHLRLPRLALSLFPKDPASWSKALDTLASGGDVRWTDDDRSREIQIQALNESTGRLQCASRTRPALVRLCSCPCVSKRAGPTINGGCSSRCGWSGQAKFFRLHPVPTSGGAELLPVGASR
jgi:hypothetical protein